MSHQPPITSKHLSSTTIIFLCMAPVVILLYASFVFNPANADNIVLYYIQVVTDFIAMTMMMGLWVTILFDAITNTHHRVLRPDSKHLPSITETTVDVLLPVAGEPLDVLQPTFEAVAKMQYPHITYVLDDSQQSEVKQLAHSFGFHYVTRQNRVFAKSGNLNNGLQFCRSEFFVIFDADQVPKEDFLLKTLPYMHDQKIGMVQTPQHFKNTHQFIASGTAQAQEVFYKHVCPSKNVSNSAFCVGTNVLFRRTAINDIGGIAEVNHSEDIWTSLKLHMHGWKTIFVNEVLAEGVAPSTIASYFRQQLRWSRGGLSMMLYHNALFVKKLTLDQRLQYFISNFFYLTGFVILYFLLTPILYLMFGLKSLQTESGSTWLLHYLPYVALYYSLSLLLIGKLRASTISVATSTFYPYILAFVSVLLGVSFKWKSTTIEERNWLVNVYWIWPHVTIIVTSLVAIVVGWYQPVNFWTTLYFSLWALLNSYFLLIFITGESRVVKESQSAII